MKKNLILVGSNGDLGSGAKKILLDKDFSLVYLIDRKVAQESNSNFAKSIQVNDLTNEEEVSKLFEEISFKRDEYYFMFSTIGGFSGGKSVEETEIKSFESMINMNLKISFLLAKYFITKVKSTKGGSICFTSAYSSFNPERNKGVYGLSKAALNYLIETIALELKDSNISINGIAPKVLDTESNREWIENKSELVSPENVGNLVYSLFENYKIVSGNIIKLPGTIQ